MRILRGLSSRVLPCGCVAGVYETYAGPIVTLLDERSGACPDPAHVEGTDIRPVPAPTGPAAPASRPPATRR